MNEDNRELEQMKSEIRLEMKEIRRMLEEIKSNTAYFREFMEKYNIPMQEEVAKDGKKRRFWIFRRRTWCWESDVAKGFPKKRSKVRSMRSKRSLDLQKRKSVRSTVLI